MTVERRAITDRDEWLEWRKQDVTASNVGALFNCHPYVTPLKLYAEKRGTEFNVEDNNAMRRGRWMEPAVAKAVMETRPEWRLVQADEYLRDPDLRLGASPDFYIEGDPRGRGILQAKSVAPSVHAREWGDGEEVPLWIILQATTEAMMADVKFAVVAGLTVDPHNMQIAIHELPRNQSAEDKIKAAVAKFWDDVEHGNEPDPDFMRDADVIKAMWRSEEPTAEIDFSGHNLLPEMLAERQKLKDAVKSAEARIEMMDSEIKWLMKDAAIATGVDGWRITFKTSDFKEYVVKARSTRILRIFDKRENAGR